MSSLTPDSIIRDALVYDGSLAAPVKQDVLIKGDKILTLTQPGQHQARHVIDAGGLALAPGFIDVHTHDDLEVIRNPGMLNKISQGVTTVIVGNCGISAAPVHLNNAIPDPLNLLGEAEEFRFPRFKDYIQAVNKAQPNVNVAALVGHTALRAQVMDNLDRSASDQELAAMQALLSGALQEGALGLSTGLAYHSAHAASPDEVEALASVLKPYQGIYTTHLRSEFDGILGALDEAFTLGRKQAVKVIISHLKCAGKANWGRAPEVLSYLRQAQTRQAIGCDCYPYSASSSTLDLKQVTGDFDIDITWSEPYPAMAGKTLKQIARIWQMPLQQAARQLQPAGAVYHGMHEEDVRHFLGFAGSMVGSDGLPCDPSPHPRLWGSFPRVLGHYVRDTGLLSLPLAIHKMTALSASEFCLPRRGYIRPGYQADLVLFSPDEVADKATFSEPQQRSAGIHGVWVNGQLTYQAQKKDFVLSGTGAGQFISGNVTNR
ncbi:D-aminoacylase [Lacimicrobium sp. SS2-24]|uniref:N-acyl-D-amino-acid deacylase family protein n=1 Tax=Lacimicrobium sp. SS2-24 TaxID=2005569 RepID=UPI001AEF8DB9|nr:D-aminoacylase [Lacimicrobium sp. SS2-24]